MESGIDKALEIGWEEKLGDTRVNGKLGEWELVERVDGKNDAHRCETEPTVKGSRGYSRGETDTYFRVHETNCITESGSLVKTADSGFMSQLTILAARG